MAEVLGIVAGGAGLASLAIQILEDVHKIRELCTGIRDAPTEFQSLLDEIQLFGTVLSLFAKDSEQTASNDVFATAQSQVIRHCQSLHDELRPILAQLASSLVGRKRTVSWVSVKSVFQRRKIDQMLMKLERAKSTLVLARLFNLAPYPPLRQASEQTEVLPMPFNKANIPHTGSAAKPSSGRSRSSYYLGIGTLTIGHIDSRSGGEDDAVTARFQFAPWLLDWALTITARKYNGILNLSLQPSYLVKANAPIFTACASGDTETVAHLISTRKASPFDTTNSGSTPLTVAAAWRQPEICRQLIELGADTSALMECEFKNSLWQWNPLALACTRLSPDVWNPSIVEDQPDLARLYRERTAYTRDTLRVLVEYGGAEVEQPVGSMSEGLETALHWFQGSPDDFSWLSAEDKITLVGSDLQDFYASVAISQSFEGDSQSTQVAMNKLPDLSQLATISLSGSTIIMGLVRMLVFDPLVLEEKRNLFEILRRLLDAGVNIHGPNLTGPTPLMYCALVSLDVFILHILRGDLDSRRWSFATVATYCTKRLKVWAKFLKQSGQDLHDYVEKEKEHGINEWIGCLSWAFRRSDDEYFTNLVTKAKIILTENSKKERLDISLVYASKTRRISVPGEWVDEKSQTSSLEDDQGWTFHYPDGDEKTLYFEDSEEDDEERSWCHGDYDE